MEMALNNMLSSLFDASCITQQDGMFVSWTPHLQDKLKNCSASTNLCDLAASKEEAARLSSFMQHMERLVAGSEHRASTMQVTLHCPGLEQVVEVKLHSIPLPSHEDTADMHARVFIGFQFMDLAVQEMQGQANDDSRFDCCGQVEALDIGASVKEELKAKDGCSHRVRLAVGDGYDADEERDASHQHMSVTKDQLGVVRKSFHDEEAASLSLSLTETWTEFSGSQKEKRRKGSSMSSMKRQAVKESKVLQDASSQTDIGLPPPLPGQSRPLPKLPKAKRHFKGRVALNSAMPVLPHFAVTPAATVRQLIFEALSHTNSGGVGCCPFHITAAAFFEHLGAITAQQCSIGYTPFTSWQCASCGSMNEDEEDGALACQVCGSEV
eukprot:TRINITY_DN17375_c0_g2_i1.p1 TRINITY_DN17375_c0_g2~~TRINITY_DN17375_c0_g2_i1.p1  ORF type:complete len:448 (+),score=69.71 TRINITY_DN17375_c0_g2_i1:200-1345(+)